MGVPAVTLRCKKIFKNDYGWNKSILDNSKRNIVRNNLFLHLVDGGCSDNLGIETAVKMLSEGKKLEPPAAKGVLIIIDAFKDYQFPYSGREREPGEASEILRTMEIGIDSRHITIVTSLEKRFRGKVDIVHCSFDYIKEYDLEEIYNYLLEIKQITKNDRGVILRGPRSVSTDFNVTKVEQSMLIEVGKRAIRNRIAEDRKRGINKAFLSLVK